MLCYLVHLLLPRYALLFRTRSYTGSAAICDVQVVRIAQDQMLTQCLSLTNFWSLLLSTQIFVDCCASEIKPRRIVSKQPLNVLRGAVC